MDEIKNGTESRAKRNADRAAAEPMPVKVTRPVRLKGFETYMIIGIVACVLLALSTLFSGIALITTGSRLSSLSAQVESLNEEISSYSKPQLQAAGSTFGVTWNGAAPLVFYPADDTGLEGGTATPMITITNPTNNAVTNIMVVWNQNAVKSLVDALNKADTDYTYKAGFENDNVTLTIEPADGGETTVFTGSMKNYAGTLSATTDPFEVSVNEAVDEMLNRLAALQAIQGQSLSFKLSAKGPKGDAISKTVTIDFVQTQYTKPAEINGPGYAAYTLNASMK